MWVSGDALVGAMIRRFGIPDSDPLRGVIYALLGARVIVVVVYGYAFMLLVDKVVVVGNTTQMILGILAYAGQVDLSSDPGSGAYALGSPWPTFVLSALIVMGNPVSFGAFLGDWLRYIPQRTAPRSLLLATLRARRRPPAISQSQVDHHGIVPKGRRAGFGCEVRAVARSALTRPGQERA